MILIYFILLVACVGLVAYAWARNDAVRSTPTARSDLSRLRPQRTSPQPLRSRARALIYGRRFDFEFVDKGGGEGWRMYILLQPPYGARAQGGHESHRYYDAVRSCHYICVHEDKQPIRSVAAAARFAQMWAKGTVRYIDTGQTF